MEFDPIPFNKPYIAGKELYYIAQAVARGNIGGDGYFTRRCAELLAERHQTQQVLMTPSCTASLEMAVMLSGLEKGDEVIMPSFTFVSTANAFDVSKGFITTSLISPIQGLAISKTW